MRPRVGPALSSKTIVILSVSACLQNHLGIVTHMHVTCFQPGPNSIKNERRIMQTSDHGRPSESRRKMPTNMSASRAVSWCGIAFPMPSALIEK